MTNGSGRAAPGGGSVPAARIIGDQSNGNGEVLARVSTFSKHVNYRCRADRAIEAGAPCSARANYPPGFRPEKEGALRALELSTLESEGPFVREHVYCIRGFNQQPSRRTTRRIFADCFRIMENDIGAQCAPFF